MSEPLLELVGVTKSYPGLSQPVLRGVDLRVAAGEAIAIVGPSGSGKSTLLNLIGTLDRADSGRLTLAGKDLTTLDESGLTALRGQQLGMIFQLHHLLPQCTVLENVLVPTLAGGPAQRREPAEARARRLLQRVGLGERLDHRPGALSGGERQRVAVVRALINEPVLLLADEPTGALDRASADALTALLLELNREEEVAVVVITHDPSVAERMGKVYTLREGVLV